MSDIDSDTDLADDLLWGVRGPKGIAAFLGIEERKARHLIDKGIIPVERLAHRTIIASRRQLRARFTVGGSPAIPNS
jgi:hypothetical protein